MAQTITEAKLRMWMQRSGPRLTALAAGICRDHHQAEEIVQEAFVKLWRRPPEAGEVAYTAWLRRVVTNLAINALKRTRRPGALPEFSTDPAMHREGGGGSRSEAGEELERVRAAMDRLAPAKRAILMLRAGEGLSYEEIAEHLGVPVGTVMSRLNRARAALMNELREEGNDEGGAAEVFPFRKYKEG